MLRSLTAALAALTLIAPAATAAEPWTAPAPVPGAPDAFPSIAFPSSGRGDITWNATTDDPAGTVAGAVVSADGAQPARTLADRFNAFAVAAYGRDRLVAAGTVMPSEGVYRAAVATGSASGALGTPRVLPTGGSVSSVRALATNTAGDVAVVAAICPRRTCNTVELALFLRRAGTSAFRRVMTLSRASAQVRRATVAVNAQGDVVAAWERRHRVYARSRTARGAVSAVQRLGDGVQVKLSAAIGATRRMVVAWGTQRVNEGETNEPFVVRAAYRGPANRSFHTARELGRVTQTGVGRYVAGTGVQAMITGSRTTVAYTTAGSGTPYAVAARDLDGAGRPLAAQQLSPTGVDAILGAATAGAAGEQVVLYVTGRAGADTAPGQSLGLGASVRGGNAGAFGAGETVATGFVDAISAAIDPLSRRPFATWRLVGEPIQLASRAPVG